MWAKLEHPENNFHIIPVEDWITHEATECPCNPLVESQDGGVMVSRHRSFDGRELLEPLEGH